MCYSAMVKAEHKKYVRAYGAVIDLDEYHRLYWEKSSVGRLKTPKAMDDGFAQPESAAEQRIKTLIDHIAAAEATRLGKV